MSSNSGRVTCSFHSADVASDAGDHASVSRHLGVPAPRLSVVFECLGVGKLSLERGQELRCGDEVVALLADIGVGASSRRSPPSSIARAIARSRCVARSAMKAVASLASRLSGSRDGWRTSRPPVRWRLGEICPSSPRRFGRRPDARRAAGTGLSERTPVCSAYSNNARTAAIRRFMVAGAAPRRSERRTTLAPAVDLVSACHSR